MAERIGESEMFHRGPWDPPYPLAPQEVLEARASDRLAALALRPSCEARATVLHYALTSGNRRAVESELATPLPPLRRDAGTSGHITLNIKRLQGIIIPLSDVRPSDTIGDIKLRLQALDSVGVIPEAMRLIHDHHEMRNDKTLDSFGLDDGAEIYLVVAPRIGAPTQATVARISGLRSRILVVETVAYGDDVRLYPKSAITVKAYDDTTYAELIEAAAGVAVERRISWPKTWSLWPDRGAEPPDHLGVVIPPHVCTVTLRAAA